MADPSEKDLDPVYVHARRETRWILLAWVFFLVWTVGYAAINGYKPVEEGISLVFGMPAWVFWGVFVPWMAATVFSVWFGLVYMRDDVLSEDEV